MAEDGDRADDWTTAPESLLDMRYEHEMQDAEEWLDEGRKPHFIAQSWFKKGDSFVQLSTERPLLVHTYRRGKNNQSYAHDAHPLIAFVHLLNTATVGSIVFISIPYFTDFAVIDHLAHYAKREKDGGRDLEVRIILGPDPMNKAELQRFIGQSRSRYDCVKRLGIREYGVCHTPQQQGKIMHSKALITTVAGMTGSYNYTYGSRYRHGEDGMVFEDAAKLAIYKKVFDSIWKSAAPVELEEPKDNKRSAEEIEESDEKINFGEDAGSG